MLTKHSRGKEGGAKGRKEGGRPTKMPARQIRHSVALRYPPPLPPKDAHGFANLFLHFPSLLRRKLVSRGRSSYWESSLRGEEQQNRASFNGMEKSFPTKMNIIKVGSGNLLRLCIIHTNFIWLHLVNIPIERFFEHSLYLAKHLWIQLPRESCCCRAMTNGGFVFALALFTTLSPIILNPHPLKQICQAVVWLA